MRFELCTWIAAALIVAGCDKSTPETQEPAPAIAAAEANADAEPDVDVAADGAAEADASSEAEPAAEPEPEPEPPKDSFTVATFNLAWGHDELADGPKRSQQNGADTPENWDWKIQQVAKLIVETKPDIVALHELGGSLEATQIVTAITEAGGPDYQWAYQDSDDPQNGHNIAILTQFPVSNERRLELHMRRQVAAEIELPTGDEITVIAIHTPEGGIAKSVSARRKQVDALARQVDKMRQQHPVIVLATMSSNVAPSDDDYAKSAAGLLAGADTRDKADDCQESADEALVIETKTDGTLGDRVFACGLEMRDAAAEGEGIIVREEVDPWNKPWAQVPTDAEPHRDVSDHLMVLAEIELPKPAAEGESTDD